MDRGYLHALSHFYHQNLFYYHPGIHSHFLPSIYYNLLENQNPFLINMNNVQIKSLEESGSNLQSRSEKQDVNREKSGRKTCNKRKKDSIEACGTTHLAPSNYLPWKQDTNNYSYGIIGLHEEIQDFVNFIAPTSKEQIMRENLVKKIENIVIELWPQAKFDVFGSFGTGLYLPKSDIDIVISGKWNGSPLYTLEKALLEKGIPESITVLDKATVPIVRLTDKTTKVRVDISYNMKNGVHSVNLIKNFLKIYPCLKPLVLVLKEFLLERDLNEVWTGGISSYSLILMCVNFLQHSREDVLHPNRVNLGVLLLEFFEYYGFRFNYNTIAIRVQDGGKLVPKSALRRLMENGSRNSILCIEDPLDPSNDIGRSSYGVLQVKRAFEHAYQLLIISVLPFYIKYQTAPSILSLILNIPKSTLEYRTWIADELDLPLPSESSSTDKNDQDAPSTCEEESNSESAASQSNTSRPTYAHVLRSGPRDNFHKSSTETPMLSPSHSQDSDTDNSESSQSSKAVLNMVSSSEGITDSSCSDDAKSESNSDSSYSTSDKEDEVSKLSHRPQRYQHQKFHRAQSERHMNESVNTTNDRHSNYSHNQPYRKSKQVSKSQLKSTSVS